MRKIVKSTIQVSIAMLFLSSLLFGSPLLIVPASAIDIPETPISKVINATEGGTFVLRYKMYFNETDPGFFALTFCWDQNESLSRPDRDKWNFTYIGFVAKFADGTSFTHPENITATVDKQLATGPGGGPEVYRYSVTIAEDYGEGNGTVASPKYFSVNVTMRAAGQSGGVYINHTAPADQNITCSSTYAAEGSVISVPEGNCKIRVMPFGVHDVAVTGIKLLRTVVGKGIATGYTLIWVNVSNQGVFTESFSVTVYYKNSTGKWTLATKPVNLAAGASIKNLEFRWDTSGLTAYTIYSINATASVVPGEVDRADNTRVEGTLTITIAGDYDGNGEPYTKDLAMVGLGWKAKYPSDIYLKYANADGADCNGEIYVKDLAQVGINWRKKVIIKP